MAHPKCTRSFENPVMEQQTCGKGRKLGFECLPTYKTLHCGRTAGKAFPRDAHYPIGHMHATNGACTLARGNCLSSRGTCCVPIKHAQTCKICVHIPTTHACSRTHMRTPTIPTQGLKTMCPPLREQHQRPRFDGNNTYRCSDTGAYLQRAKKVTKNCGDNTCCCTDKGVALPRVGGGGFWAPASENGGHIIGVLVGTVSQQGLKIDGILSCTHTRRMKSYRDYVCGRTSGDARRRAQTQP